MYATHGPETCARELYPNHTPEGRLRNARSYACASAPRLRGKLDIWILRKNETQKSLSTFDRGSCLQLPRRLTANSGGTLDTTPADQIRASERGGIPKHPRGKQIVRVHPIGPSVLVESEDERSAQSRTRASTSAAQLFASERNRALSEPIKKHIEVNAPSPREAFFAAIDDEMQIAVERQRPWGMGWDFGPSPEKLGVARAGGLNMVKRKQIFGQRPKTLGGGGNMVTTENTQNIGGGPAQQKKKVSDLKNVRSKRLVRRKRFVS